MVACLVALYAKLLVYYSSSVVHFISCFTVRNIENKYKIRKCYCKGCFALLRTPMFNVVHVVSAIESEQSSKMPRIFSIRQKQNCYRPNKHQFLLKRNFHVQFNFRLLPQTQAVHTFGLFHLTRAKPLKVAPGDESKTARQ